MTLITAAAEAAGYEAFVSALRFSNLVETLQGAGPFTVFAPNDEAFDESNDAVRKLLKGGRTRLRAVLKNHVAAGRVTSKQFAGKRIRAVTLGGGSIVIDGRNGLVVGGARVSEPDVRASNGIIHGIEGLLWPVVEETA